MDFSVVLNHLQNMYPGQLVLYCDDIAKILGTSDKAIAHLIARDRLPFKVKKVGGQRCVDIFQVAQWMFSDEAIAIDCVGEVPKSAKSESKSKAIQTAKPSATQTSPVDAQKGLTGNIAAEVLKMRHDYAPAMRRLVHGLRATDDIVFMNEVMEKLFFAFDLLPSSFVVISKRLAFKGAKPLAEEIRTYFESESDAVDVIVGNLVDWRHCKDLDVEKFNQHIVLEHSGQILFHAIFAGKCLSIVESSIGLDLPGF